MNRIGLQNFRVFSDMQILEISPITITTGANSSGKSSYFKAIRLLKDNFQKETKYFASKFDNLVFDNSKHHLGGYSKVKSKYSTDDEITFLTSYYSEFFGEEVISKLTYEHNSETKRDNGTIKSYELLTSSKTLANIYYVTQEANKNRRKYKHWFLKFNSELWFEYLYKLLNIGTWQFQVLSLIRKLHNLDWAVQERKASDPLSEPERKLLEELLEQGYSFDKELKSNPIVNVIQGFHQDDIWNIIDKKGKKVNYNHLAHRLIRTTKISNLLFYFKYVENLVKLDVTNPQNVDFDSLESLEDKEKAFQLSGELLANNITSKSDLSTILKDIEFNYLKKTVFGLKTTIGPIPLPNGDVDYEEEFSALIWYLDKKSTISSLESAEFDDFIDGLFSENNIIEDIKKEEIKHKESTVKKTIDFIEEIVFKEIQLSLKSFEEIGKYEFIDSDRADIQRLYSDNNKSQFGQILGDYQDLHIDFLHNRIPFINKWIKEFEIADELDIVRDEEGLGVRLYLIKDNQKMLLADVGFGVNQLLPLIIRIATIKNNKTICVEEPESNLHPAFQSKLAELFLDAHQQYGMRFIIETHSEYIIRKFQYLVANPEYKTKAHDISIYYLYHPEKVPEGKKQVEKLTIEADGGLNGDFGRGFFDESSNWKRELMRIKHIQRN